MPVRLAHLLSRAPALRYLLLGLCLSVTLSATLSVNAAWGFDIQAHVKTLAAQRAQQPFADTASAMPGELAQLSYDGWRDIRFKPGQALWQTEGLPFEAMFFHVARQGQAVRLHEVSAAGVRELPYAPSDYSYGKNRLQPERWGDLGHAGFRLHYPLNTTAYKDELIAFLGASYFRALGRDQRYGLSARGLAVDTVGSTSGREEFPRFTDFWLEKPAAGAQQVRLWALLDSPRVTGAYRFDVVPGDNTRVVVHAQLFMRASDTPIATLGMAPLTSMFFFGENQPRPGDFRPEVHDSDGLMIASADGEWLWRPLQNPSAPVASSFALKGLRGFGLMQRDRSFASYEDTEARYELRPSAWITPLGDWGPGRVELLQLPTPDETHDNVAAYWVPQRLPAPGQPFEMAYEISWQGPGQQRPPNGWAVQSRRGRGYATAPIANASSNSVQYVVDFAGPALEALAEDAPVQAVASSDANGRITEKLVYRHPVTGAWRMTLQVERLDAARPVELRAFLKHQQHTLTETWTLLITP